MNVRPLHDRIIVQRLEEGEQKIGGIIIPDTAKEKPQQGKVIAVGKGKIKDDGKVLPLDVKEGDTILFGKYSGQEIKLDGEEYLIMREDEVLAVIETAQEVAGRLGSAHDDPRAPAARVEELITWQSRLSTARSRARRFSAASTSWPTRSRSRSAPRAATSSSTRSSARPPSPRTA